MGSIADRLRDGEGDDATTEAATARIIAVANLKGGTGKSTLAVNLACLAAQAHGRAALVDADPQGTAAAWLAGDSHGRPPGLVVEAWPVIDAADLRAADLWAERVYRLAEDHVRVVIDMPPQPGAGFEAMLHLTDALVIPVTPSAIDLRATATTLQRLQRAQKMRGGRPACLLAPNRVDQRTAVGRTIQRALRDLDIEVTPPITQRASHATAFSARQWIGAHAPGSPAFREMAAVAAVLEKLLATCPSSDYDGAPLALGPSSIVMESVHEGRNGHGQRGGILATLIAGIRLLARPQSG